MRNKVKLLIGLNLMCYLSYFIYSYVDLNMEIKNLWVVVAIIPYFLVIYSSFIAFDRQRSKIKNFRLAAILDLILRICALFINFYATSINTQSLKFKLVFLVLITLLILNIFLELFMYNKVKKQNHIEKQIKWDDLSWEDRRNFNNMYMSYTKSIFEPFILMIVITTILGFNINSSTSSVVVYSIVDIFLLIYFIKHRYLSLSLFYQDKEVLNKIFMKENIFIGINVFLGVIFAIFRMLGYGNTDIIKFILFILQMSILYPYFKLRGERARKVFEIKKIKESI